MRKISSLSLTFTKMKTQTVYLKCGLDGYEKQRQAMKLKTKWAPDMTSEERATRNEIFRNYVVSLIPFFPRFH